MWRSTYLPEPCYHGQTHPETRKYNIHVTNVQSLLRYGHRTTFSITILYHMLRCNMFVIMHVLYEVLNFLLYFADLHRILPYHATILSNV